MERTERTEALKKLREPFPAHQISKLPKPTKAQTDAVKADFHAGIRCNLCGAWHHPKVVHLDYVGHAALTDRLLDVDLEWAWKPMSFDADGLPRYDKNGGLWIYLTICGVTKPGYGNAEGKTGGDAVKEIIGDALRNAAMRFGCALDLWHKGDLHPEYDEPKINEPARETPAAPADEPESGVVKGWTVEAQDMFVDLQDKIYTAFKNAGKLDKHPDEAEKWRKRMASDTAENVLVPMAKFVDKLTEAAKASKPEAA